MKLSVITPTHNIKWLDKTWESVRNQTHHDWEWVVLCNGPKASYYRDFVKSMVGDHPRVRVEAANIAGGIGAIKGHAFRLGAGDALVELDHDDLLVPHALGTIAAAMEKHTDCGFFYSDCADFSADGKPHTYMMPGARQAWEKNGWVFTKTTLDSGKYIHPVAFKPSAAALSSISWAPNHVRVWRTNVYHTIGGHNGQYTIADDHELLIRTYLATRMHHIPRLLYLYRCSDENTWAQRIGEIRQLSNRLGRENLEALVLREAQLRKLPVYDLGCGENPRAGWRSVDRCNFDTVQPDVITDLRGIWEWENDSVFAFRAADLLEHLPNKQRTMEEIWKCLAPGGWLLSQTPSTDGRGAFMDPTHVSYWNENSFWYWTRPGVGQYIHNDRFYFFEAELGTFFPGTWHEQYNIPYVRANLMADKPGWSGPVFRG